jgi:hypothetical protein
MSTTRLSAFGLLALALGGCSPDFLLADMNKPGAVGDSGTTADDLGDTGALDDEGDEGSDDGEDQGTTDGGDDGSGGDDPDNNTVEQDRDDDDDEGTPDNETDPAPEDDCDETSELVYVLDKDSGALSLFDPTTGTLSSLGTPDCDSWGSPASMGIARDGHAYLRYSDNELFVVDLATMDCSLSTYDAGSSGFGSFGMGFATPTAETWRDQLFVANSRTLASLDTSTWTLQALGSLPSQGELTGTGAGELFAVLPLESPMRVVELDQGTGAVLDTISTGTTLDISNLDTFAFAAWGGDFYLFLRYYGMGNTTEVWRIDRDGDLERVVSELGINVVGAGVSTCAPTE